MKRNSLTVVVSVLVLILLLGVSACRPKTYNDGTFTGISQGDKHGFAIAEVTVQKGKISAVTLTEMTELGVKKDYATYPYAKAKEAHDTLEKAFVGKQNNQVDVVAGATQSSKKYMEAVGFALEKAKKTPTVKSAYFDGTFQGQSKADQQGYGVAWVTIKEDKITAVDLEEVTAGDQFKDWATYPWPKALEAKTEMPKRFIAANAATVDAFTGATGSSTKWIEAVGEALKAAKVR